MLYKLDYIKQICYYYPITIQNNEVIELNNLKGIAFKDILLMSKILENSCPVYDIGEYQSRNTNYHSCINEVVNDKNVIFHKYFFFQM